MLHGMRGRYPAAGLLIGLKHTIALWGKRLVHHQQKSAKYTGRAGDGSSGLTDKPSVHQNEAHE
eukprot:18662-Eustigmatos_ZCMA.PRE.1